MLTLLWLWGSNFPIKCQYKPNFGNWFLIRSVYFQFYTRIFALIVIIPNQLTIGGSKNTQLVPITSISNFTQIYPAICPQNLNLVFHMGWHLNFCLNLFQTIKAKETTKVEGEFGKSWVVWHEIAFGRTSGFICTYVLNRIFIYIRCDIYTSSHVDVELSYTYLWNYILFHLFYPNHTHIHTDTHTHIHTHTLSLSLSLLVTNLINFMLMTHLPNEYPGLPREYIAVIVSTSLESPSIL